MSNHTVSVLSGIALSLSAQCPLPLLFSSLAIFLYSVCSILPYITKLFSFCPACFSCLPSVISFLSITQFHPPYTLILFLAFVFFSFSTLSLILIIIILASLTPYHSSIVFSYSHIFTLSFSLSHPLDLLLLSTISVSLSPLFPAALPPLLPSPPLIPLSSLLSSVFLLLRDAVPWLLCASPPPLHPTVEPVSTIPGDIPLSMYCCPASLASVSCSPRYTSCPLHSVSDPLASPLTVIHHTTHPLRLTTCPLLLFVSHSTPRTPVCLSHPIHYSYLSHTPHPLLMSVSHTTSINPVCLTYHAHHSSLPHISRSKERGQLSHTTERTLNPLPLCVPRHFSKYTPLSKVCKIHCLCLLPTASLSKCAESDR